MDDMASLQMKILLTAHGACGKVLNNLKIGLAVWNVWQIG